MYVCMYKHVNIYKNLLILYMYSLNINYIKRTYFVSIAAAIRLATGRAPSTHTQRGSEPSLSLAHKTLHHYLLDRSHFATIAIV